MDEGENSTWKPKENSSAEGVLKSGLNQEKSRPTKVAAPRPEPVGVRIPFGKGFDRRSGIGVRPPSLLETNGVLVLNPVVFCQSLLGLAK